jgi:hypothetical protein
MPDDPEGLISASLDEVTDEVNRVLDEQRRWSDAIDTKCGLALAFAGALIALTREDARLLVVWGRIVGAVAGAIALVVVFPWREPAPIKPRQLCGHLGSDPAATRRFLLFFNGLRYLALEELIERKRLGLRVTLAVLAISLTLLTLGVTLSKVDGGGS